MAKLNTKKVVRDILSIFKSSNNTCTSCKKVDQTIISFKLIKYHTSKPLELFHTNLCGPMRTQSINDDKYFLLCIDDYSIMTWVDFLKHKSYDFDMFNIFKK